MMLITMRKIDKMGISHIFARQCWTTEDLHGQLHVHEREKVRLAVANYQNSIKTKLFRLLLQEE